MNSLKKLKEEIESQQNSNFSTTLTQLLELISDIEEIPSKEETFWFLNLLKAKNDSTNEHKKQALDKLFTYFESSTTQSSKSLLIKSLDRNLLISQVALRIFDLSKIVQLKTPFCGPIVFFQSLAFINPFRFVQVCLNLLERGQVKLGTINIKLNWFLRNYNFSNQPLKGILDFFLSAALRDSNNYLFPIINGTNPIAGMTTTKELCYWLKDLNHTEICDQTFNFGFQTLFPDSYQHFSFPLKKEKDKLKSLNLAIQKLSDGHFLFLLASTDLTRVLTGSKAIDGFFERTGIELHIMVVLGIKLIKENEESLLPTAVQFDSVTWGVRSQFQHTITWNNIEKWYRGFISFLPNPNIVVE